MTQADQHNEIELNLINRGQVIFQHGSQELAVKEGNFVIYWAASPHRVVATRPNTDLTWLSLPLSLFLSWHLASSLKNHILQGNTVLLTDEQVEVLDYLRLNQWVKDISTRQPELLRISELELEVFFCRLALNHSAGQLRTNPKSHRRLLAEHQYSKVQLMVRFMTENACESLTVPRIAAISGLTPEYAMRIFRHTWGMTIWNFLIQQRISHAQRLLVVTNDKILEIAHACGFDSLSRFYVAFQKQCGCTPIAYRKKAR